MTPHTTRGGCLCWQCILTRFCHVPVDHPCFAETALVGVMTDTLTGLTGQDPPIEPDGGRWAGQTPWFSVCGIPLRWPTGRGRGEEA